MIVVTGATGFIGSYLIHELNQNGIEDIIAVDYVAPTERPQPLTGAKFKEFIEADAFLNQLDTIDGIRQIFHMGACSSTTESNWNYLKKVNVEYSQKLFQFCTKAKLPFFYASSGAVYGDGSRGFDDNTPTSEFNPLNLYGKSKQDFDIWVEKQAHTPPAWAGYRFFNVYGPNEYHKNAMASVAFKAFHQIKESGTLNLFRSHNPEYQDGQQLRDFVYVKDICRWMIEIAAKPKFASGIYNMGFGEARPWLALAESVFKAMERPMKINWIDIPTNIRNQYQYFTEANIDRLLEQSVSAPKWPVETGVTDYVKNYLFPAFGNGGR